MISRMNTFLSGLLLLCGACLAHGAEYASHPPLRVPPGPSNRPMSEGPARFADAARGDDANAGTKESPWRSISHALKHLKAGETLYLRRGTYYENVYCSLIGREKSPITIRSYPGEQAIIDGGFREFFESPATAWQPYPEGAPGEFRSAKPYPNIREVIGSFGDSMIGLNTYYHAMDLRAKNELWHWEDWNQSKTTDAAPLYCGPGLWYDRESGYIHVRLAHTNVAGAPNYRGETDPRKLPLVIAPFRSVPLRVDRAEHVRFQDLVIRGAGYDAVILDYAENVEFENVTIWCGTYGIRAVRTGPLRIHNCGVYGNVPPWLARSDTSKRAYPGRPHRDITRLNTHATLVIEAGREFSVFATPVNDNWEISYSEFTDSSDGPYLGGVSLRFHHNILHNTQDDGIYLSPMYPRHRYTRSGAEIHIYQNYIARVLTAIAFGGPEDTKDRVFIYRNVFDLREPIYTSRPTTQKRELGRSFGKVMGDHGSPPWPEMYIYHNLFVMAETPRNWGMGVLNGTSKERPRRVFNNIFLHLGGMPEAWITGVEHDLQVDGNLYWSLTPQAKSADPFARFRGSKYFEASKQQSPPGWEANSFVADPIFLKFSPEPGAMNDYRLGKDSPAIGKGLVLPADYPDPLRPPNGARPDIGPFPAGSEQGHVGRGTK